MKSEHFFIEKEEKEEEKEHCFNFVFMLSQSISFFWSKETELAQYFLYTYFINHIFALSFPYKKFLLFLSLVSQHRLVVFDQLQSSSKSVLPTDNSQVRKPPLYSDVIYAPRNTSNNLPISSHIRICLNYIPCYFQDQSYF